MGLSKEERQSIKEGSSLANDSEFLMLYPHDARALFDTCDELEAQVRAAMSTLDATAKSLEQVTVQRDRAEQVVDDLQEVTAQRDALARAIRHFLHVITQKRAVTPEMIHVQIQELKQALALVRKEE